MVRGFYTNSTNFDVQAALANHSSPQYGQLINDIDAIAVQLKKFQDAGVPVVWRPLHKTQGGWFWWGAKGPEAFVQLWRLMHDRLTNVDGLHNLIWTYTSSDAQQDFRKWYPGDDVVDVVGMDNYVDKSSSMSGQWYDMLDEYNGRKMIALSETGNLPNIDLMRKLGVHWDWFNPWDSSSVLANYSPDELRRFSAIRMWSRSMSFRRCRGKHSSPSRAPRF